jgi:hypothetical protein
MIVAFDPPIHTPAEVANAVWDELLVDHTIVGSTGAKLADLPIVSAEDIAEAVWSYERE